VLVSVKVSAATGAAIVVATRVAARSEVRNIVCPFTDMLLMKLM
jgi:hypothetical protein